MFQVILTSVLFALLMMTTACSTQDFSGGTKIQKTKGNNLKGDTDASDGADSSDGIDGDDSSDGKGGLDSGGDSDSSDSDGGGSDDEDGSLEEGEGEGGKLVIAKVDVVKGCSDVGSKHSGSTLLTATGGVALVMINSSGAKSIVHDSAKAKDLRDDIVDYGTFTLKTSSLPSSGSFALALCDLSSEAQCMSALEAASFSGNADDLRHFSDGIIGYGEGFSTSGGKLVQTGPINALYTGADKFSGNADCEVKKSPLIFDLDGSGIVLSRPTRGVDFDIDHDGIRNRISWPTKANAGFLALDLDGNGSIDHGGELFGDSTLIGAEKAKNGFQALAQYDDDKNDAIDQTDSIYSQLVVWIDINQNGVSEAGELQALKSLGITSLKVSYQNVDKPDQFGNSIMQESNAMLKGKSIGFFDLWFRLID